MTNAQHTLGATFSDSKQHYEILDGLRGVAAIMVVAFHLFEIFSGGDHHRQIINHGYLAVDFFFLLSGFVIGYAYDDRWHKMSVAGFFKRRLIRLHPMIIMGMLIGAVGFYFSASPILFPGISSVPVWKVLLVMLVGFTLLPLPLSMDIRGWTEMHPLNGPAWSLFYEYVANILYGLFLRKASKTVLWVLVLLAAAALLHFAVTNPRGDVIGGWSLTPEQIRVGLTRVCFPFFAGLLLSRTVQPGKIQRAFWWSSLILIVIFSIPRLGGSGAEWQNGLYDALAIILVFPLVVFIGASGQLAEGWSARLSRFLGDISYPIYIIHYPLIYIFSAWVVDAQPPTHQAVLVAFLVLALAIGIAYLALKYFDIPVRRWLTKRFLS